MALKPLQNDPIVDEGLDVPDFAEILNMQMGEAPRPGPPPVGTYTVTVPHDGVTFGKASTGTPQVRITLRLDEAAEDVEQEALNHYLTRPDGTTMPLMNKTISQMFWFSDAAMYRLDDFLQSVGIPKQSYNTAFNALKGMTFRVHITHQPPNKNGLIFPAIDHSGPLPAPSTRRR